MCIHFLMKKFLNIYLLSLENKMKTPYRKLTMKRGANAIEIFEIISIAVKILRQKSWKSRCTWVAESSRISIFHRKSTPSEIKLIFSCYIHIFEPKFWFEIQLQTLAFRPACQNVCTVRLVRFVSIVWIVSIVCNVSIVRLVFIVRFVSIVR